MEQVKRGNVNETAKRLAENLQGALRDARAQSSIYSKQATDRVFEAWKARNSPEEAHGATKAPWTSPPGYGSPAGVRGAPPGAGAGGQGRAGADPAALYLHGEPRQAGYRCPLPQGAPNFPPHGPLVASPGRAFCTPPLQVWQMATDAVNRINSLPPVQRVESLMLPYISPVLERVQSTEAYKNLVAHLQPKAGGQQVTPLEPQLQTRVGVASQ